MTTGRPTDRFQNRRVIAASYQLERTRRRIQRQAVGSVFRVVLICLLGAPLPSCVTDAGIGLAGGDNASHGDGAPGPGADEAMLLRVAGDMESHGKIDAALPLYEQAAAVSADDTAAQIRLGDAYLRAGNASQAIKVYRAVLARASDNGGALLGLGTALVKTGDIDAAVPLLTKAAPLVNTMSAYNRLGVAQTLTGNFADAQASFEVARSLAPDDLDVRTNLALAAALDGKQDTAIALMREVVAAPAAQARHRRTLVVVLGLSGRTAEASAAAPRELPAAEVKNLLARSQSIRLMTDARARAKALGTVMG
jgi:Flp pilus assembly protein TadD